MAIDRVFSQAGPDDEGFLLSLRPQRLGECIGQAKVREQLGIALDAARQRHEPLDHVLLDGPPGLGKTTLAHVIANEMGARIHVTSGPAIARQGDLMMLLTQLETGDVLFIDEIHRLSKPVEEFLYPALEAASAGAPSTSRSNASRSSARRPGPACSRRLCAAASACRCTCSTTRTTN